MTIMFHQGEPVRITSSVEPTSDRMRLTVMGVYVDGRGAASVTEDLHKLAYAPGDAIPPHLLDALTRLLDRVPVST